METPRRRRRLFLELDDRLEEALRRIGGEPAAAARLAILRWGDAAAVLERLERIEAQLAGVRLQAAVPPAEVPSGAADLARDLLAGFGADESGEEERR